MTKKEIPLGVKVIFIFYIIVIISYFIDFIYINFIYSGHESPFYYSVSGLLEFIAFIASGITSMQLYMPYVLGDSLGYLIYNMTLYPFQDFLPDTFVFAATLLYIFSLVGLFLKAYFVRIARILFIVLSCLGILGVVRRFVDYPFYKLDFIVVIFILIEFAFIVINIFIITYLFFNKKAKEFFS